MGSPSDRSILQAFNLTASSVRKEAEELGKYLETAKDFYEELLQEQREADKQKLFEAYEKSNRSFDEIIDFMKGKADL